MDDRFQKPRIVASLQGELYIAQFITPQDVTKFRKVVDIDFKGDSNLRNTYTDEAEGSSLIGNIIMADVLAEDGWKIADLPQIYDANRTFGANKDNRFGVSTRNKYSDGRFVIRAKNEETEHILTQVGDKKLTKEGKQGVLKTPIAFQFTGIKVRANCPLRGYFIELTPQAQFVGASQYLPENKGKKFSFFDSNGNPRISDDGVHTIYNNNCAVVRVSTNGDLDLNVGSVNLAFSNTVGRVVKYRAEGTEKNITEKLAEEMNRRIQELVDKQNRVHSERLEKIVNFVATLNR